MCLPVAATAIPWLIGAQVALGVGGAVLQFQQAQANASAQNKYQKQVYKTNKELADANAIRAYAALQERASQENALASKSIQNVMDQATRARAAALTASGESGTAGASVSQVYQDFARQEAEYTGTIVRQRVFQTAQLNAEAKAVQLGQQAQTASATPKPIEQPNFMGALLRIGEVGVNAWTNQYLLNK